MSSDWAAIGMNSDVHRLVDESVSGAFVLRADGRRARPASPAAVGPSPKAAVRADLAELGELRGSPNALRPATPEG
jgi:hypothetical protein